MWMIKEAPEAKHRRLELLCVHFSSGLLHLEEGPLLHPSEMYSLLFSCVYKEGK
ncbi:hypothetical protein [Paenibacillus farraposensis]|uniref:hypothetical protein n=1 Tax=Paenibacillus farraposensis TaxID=2807095 RepID=UPI00366B2152